jgi:hypothetical protein
MNELRLVNTLRRNRDIFALRPTTLGEYRRSGQSDAKFRPCRRAMDLGDGIEDPFRAGDLWQPSKFTFHPLQTLESLTRETDLPGMLITLFITWCKN